MIAPPEWFKAYIGVCAFAGLRLGKAPGLQVGDIDFLRWTLTVNRQVQGENRQNAEVVAPKHGSERVIFVSARFTEVIARHIEQVGVHGDEQWLFSTGGHLWSRGWLGTTGPRSEKLAGWVITSCTTSGIFTLKR